MKKLDQIIDINNLKRFYGDMHRENRDGIILNPLQTGGRLTEAAKEVLVEYADGYSVCDHCKGRLDEIVHPPIQQFVHEHLPAFLGADVARVTGGAREGIFMVMHAIAKPGDTIIVDRNRHYSTDVAIQRAGLNLVKVENSGDPERVINVEDYIPLIKEYKPKLIFLTYPDGDRGNLPDAKRLGEISKEFNIPYIINGAYAVGRMPISMDEIGADFIIGSGHKSMASAGPVGVIGMKKEWESQVLYLSPTAKVKEVECLGCTARGVPLMTLMASFPYVVERTNNWNEEVAKAQWFSNEMEELGMIQLGEKPHRHDLMQFQTDILRSISETHPKKRAFLYDALKEQHISGLKHGQTQYMKISTYGTPKEDLVKVLDVFDNLINTYGQR